MWPFPLISFPVEDHDSEQRDYHEQRQQHKGLEFWNGVCAFDLNRFVALRVVEVDVSVVSQSFDRLVAVENAANDYCPLT